MVVLSNLSFYINEIWINDFFKNKCGKVLSVEMIKGGKALVSFNTEEEMDRALKLNG